MYLSNPEAATFNGAHLTLKIAFLLSIIILFYNEFSLHMKSKVRGRRKNSGKCNQKNDQQVRFQRACWRYFFYYGKVSSGKNYPSVNVSFWHLAFGNVCGFSKLKDKHWCVTCHLVLVYVYVQVHLHINLVSSFLAQF